MAVALEDGSLDLVDPLTGQSLCDLPTHRTPIRSLTFIDAGSEAILVSRGDDGAQAIILRSEEHEEDVATPDGTDPGDEDEAAPAYLLGHQNG